MLVLLRRSLADNLPLFAPVTSLKLRDTYSGLQGGGVAAWGHSGGHCVPAALDKKEPV